MSHALFPKSPAQQPQHLGQQIHVVASVLGPLPYFPYHQHIYVFEQNI